MLAASLVSGVVYMECSGAQAQKNPGIWPGFRFLVAGAHLSNYMQIEIESFPFVA